MKIFLCTLTCAALLLLAGAAHAYAIYNHIDHTACLAHFFSMSGCDIKVHGHSTYNGEHGAGLKRVWATYSSKDKNYKSDEFSIPDGGYARIYSRKIKIYTHHGKHVKTVSIQESGI